MSAYSADSSNLSDDILDYVLQELRANFYPNAICTVHKQGRLIYFITGVHRFSEYALDAEVSM
jgi:hypothetical protein